MLIPPPPLSLMIVCDDWFARSLLRSVAEETGRFGRIAVADDGYTALADTWQGVEDGNPPNVYLIDGASAGPSGERLVMELRHDPATEHSYIAVLSGDDMVLISRADLITRCTWDAEELSGMLTTVANAAAATVHPSR